VFMSFQHISVPALTAKVKVETKIICFVVVHCCCLRW
jgi:TRAP-type C4-dicarboxylate transport system permease small subunit